MRHGIFEWLDIAILVLVMSMSVMQFPILFEETSKPIIKDYEDKTALFAGGSVYTELANKTGAELMMSIVNADENTPYPRSIKINNTKIIDLDNAFIANKQLNISGIYSSSGEYKLGTMLNWNIESVTFVQDKINGDYWHYVLVKPE